MVKIRGLVRTRDDGVLKDYEHYQDNIISENFPFVPCKNIKYNPFKDKKVTFTPEDYIEENFLVNIVDDVNVGGNYEWVDLRWLVVRNEEQDISFFSPDNAWKVKLLCIENYDYVPQRSFNSENVTNVFKRTSLPMYYKVGAPILISDHNSDDCVFKYQGIYDRWFSEWYIYHQGMMNLDAEKEVKLHFRNIELPRADNLVDADVKFDPDILNGWISGLNILSEDDKFQFLSYLRTYVCGSYPVDSFNSGDNRFYPGGNNQIILTDAAIRSAITDIGKNPTIDFNRKPWFNLRLNQGEQPTLVVSSDDDVLDHFADLNFVKGYTHDDLSNYPAQPLSRWDVGTFWQIPTQDEDEDGGLFNSTLTTNAGFSTSNFAVNTSQYRRGENTLVGNYDDWYDWKNNYNIGDETNPKYVYVLLNASAFRNLVDTELKITATDTGTYFKNQTTTTTTVTSPEDVQISSLNSTFLIPVPKTALPSYCFDEDEKLPGISNFVEHIINKVMLVSYTTGDDVVGNYTLGNPADAIKGYWVSELNPEELSILALNTEQQDTANSSIHISNDIEETKHYPANIQTLCFMDSYTSLFMCPAILMGSEAYYLIQERNDLPEDYYTKFFKNVDKFTNGNFMTWDSKTEPSILSPSAQILYQNVGSGAGSQITLDATVFKLDNFQTDAWTFGSSYSFVDLMPQLKINLNELKSTTYIWTELEDVLTFKLPRSMPYELNAYAISARSQQEAFNTSVNVQNKQWDMIEKWNKIQTETTFTGNLIGGVSGMIAGGLSGFAGGAKGGGGRLGGGLGAAGGIISAGGEMAVNMINADMERKNRDDALALDKQVTSMNWLSGRQNMNDVTSVRFPAEGVSPILQLANNGNVKNQTNGMGKWRTLEIIEEQKENAVYTAKMYGRPYNYWARYNDYNCFTVSNFFELSEISKSKQAQYVYGLSQWLEENLTDDYKHTQIMTCSNMDVFFARLYAGIRLIEIIPDDFDDILDKHEKILDQRIVNKELLHEDDAWRRGHSNFIPVNGHFHSDTDVVSVPWWVIAKNQN